MTHTQRTLLVALLTLAMAPAVARAQAAPPPTDYPTTTQQARPMPPDPYAPSTTITAPMQPTGDSYASSYYGYPGYEVNAVPPAKARQVIARAQFDQARTTMYRVVD